MFCSLSTPLFTCLKSMWATNLYSNQALRKVISTSPAHTVLAGPFRQNKISPVKLRSRPIVSSVRSNNNNCTIFIILNKENV
jgi:hypothetical protein